MDNSKRNALEVYLDPIDWALVAAAAFSADEPIGDWAARTLARAAAVTLDTWLPVYIDVLDNERGEGHA